MAACDWTNEATFDAEVNVIAENRNHAPAKGHISIWTCFFHSGKHPAAFLLLKYFVGYKADHSNAVLLSLGYIKGSTEYGDMMLMIQLHISCCAVSSANQENSWSVFASLFEWSCVRSVNLRAAGSADHSCSGLNVKSASVCSLSVKLKPLVFPCTSLLYQYKGSAGFADGNVFKQAALDFFTCKEVFHVLCLKPLHRTRLQQKLTPNNDTFSLNIVWMSVLKL